MEAVLRKLSTTIGIAAASTFFALTANGAEVLRIPLHTQSITLDPMHVQDSQSLWVGRQIHCQLVRMKGREVTLEAANDVRYLDPLKLQITLKPDLKFHDGSPLTAYDVEATLRALETKRTVQRNVFGWLKSYKATSPMVLVMELKHEVPQFLKFIASPNYAIFPRAFVAKALATPSLWSSPIGCGGYRLENAKSPHTITLSPVKSGRPIEFHLMAGKVLDENSAIRFDFIDSPFAESLKKPEGFRDEGVFDPRQVYIAINSSLPRWKTSKTRCDFLSKLDSAVLVPAYQGVAEPATHFFPRGILGYEASRPNPAATHHAEKKDLAIHEPGACLTFLAGSIPVELRKTYVDFVTLHVGPVRTRVIESARQFAEDFLKSKCDFLAFALKSNYLDGFEFLQVFAYDRISVTGVNDRNLQQEIIASQSVNDPKQRSQIYQNLVKKVNEQCWIKPLVTLPRRKVLVKSGLTTPGLGEVPINEYYLGNVQ